MGQKQNSDVIEYGNDCSLKFPAGETPKYLYARYISIETCPGAPIIAPNDTTFKMPQTGPSPCIWIYNGPLWHCEFFYNAVGVYSRLYLKYKPTFDHYFLADIAGYVDEGTVFHNGIDNCLGVNQGKHGIGIVTWTLEALEVLSLINIPTSDDLFMELFPIADGSRVYKFCKLQDATNVKILYDP